MILRKPYAFIIRHFRLIHLLMLGCLLYLLMLARDISGLFTTLQSTKTFVYPGAGVYINNFVFFVIFALLGLSGIVYWLLTEKKKPTKLYLFLIIYSVIEIVLFYYEFGLLRTLIESPLEQETLILGKDIATICTIPNYFFIALCFIRGIGFNLKQFNFSKDIKELELTDEDAAEFEVLIGQNNYKYFRFIRRTIREIKYYILENKFAISVFGTILLVFFGLYGIYYYTSYIKKMGESEASSINGITYQVKSSYITAYDFNGKPIDNTYKYVVVDMTFYNNLDVDKTINLDKITLANGELVYYPIQTKNNKFYDLGVPYNKGEKLPSRTEVHATLAYQIPRTVSNRNFSLRIEYKLDDTGAKLITRYKIFDIVARKLDKERLDLNRNINETINSNVIEKNKLNLTITGYSILDSYDNKYVKCKNINDCVALSQVIKPGRVNSETMLVIDYKSVVGDDAIFARTFNNNNKVFTNFCDVSYVIFNKEYTTKPKVVTNSNVDGKIFIVMDRKLVNATEITLHFNFRDATFTVPLLVPTTPDVIVE